ncbi:hypothetical protein [uncultured Kordia sp.]|uniref:hypothetical protein n=1 Tax=uncultured Kordia sp. TaxID=507699 RepID=UPI00261BE982|nr:hypothetical protein [uncultured Kordia sp.]
MSNKIYKTFILFLIGSFGLIAQTEKKYQKTFRVDKNTKLLFETQNIDVTFKTWDRDEVKVDFTVDFKNYSEEEIKKISDGIIMSAQMETSMGDMNYLQIRNASATSIGRLSYQVSGGKISIENFLTDKNEPNRYRTVQDINKEISKSYDGFNAMEGHIIFENESIALKDVDKSNHKGVLRIRSKYEIYLPSYLEIDINVSQAQVDFDGTFTNVIRGVFQESELTADELNNEGNSIQFMNGSVRVKKLIGGTYYFRNVTFGLFGEIESLLMNTEFSKISIGKAGKNLQFKDFKSDFFFYNLANDFKLITMMCEYSDIKMYIDQDQKYYMEAVGHNAILKDGKAKIIMQPNKEGRKQKMFTRGKDTEENRKNMFKLDLIHGFITLFYNK